jgi:hypothetical protein
MCYIKFGLINHKQHVLMLVVSLSERAFGVFQFWLPTSQSVNGRNEQRPVEGCNSWYASGPSDR